MFHRYGRFSDRLLLFGWALLEPLGYRQLTALWRVRGLLRFLGKRKDWGVITRSGFDTTSADRGARHDAVKKSA